MRSIEVEINGARHRIETEPARDLLTVLRNELDLTGAKYGCGEGQCGACTVLIDGQAARSCTTPLSAVAGKRITTIEGLETGGRLHPLQEAFIEEVAMQCGYCTTGMIMSAAGLLRKNPAPADDEIVRAMRGNICRCGTYPRIIESIKRAAGKSQKGGGQ